MRRWMTPLALLAAPIWAQDSEDVPRPGQIFRDDLRGATRIARGERDAPTAFVRLREGGALQVKAGEEWKDATLDGVAKFLKEFAEAQDREMQKDGKSAYEKTPGGAKVSRLFVSLDVEPTVPWQDVLWLIVAAKEQAFRKIELCDGTRKMLAFLPVETGKEVGPGDPPLEIRISVHAVARREKVATWGNVQVNRPTDVRYKIGNDETTDLGDVREFIKKSLRAVEGMPNAGISGEIKAGNKVPLEKVFDLIEVFDTMGLRDVCFFGAVAAPAEVRRAERLPFPLKNYDVAD